MKICPATYLCEEECPAYCGYEGGMVPDGLGGEKECPAILPEPAGTCPTYCGYLGGDVIPDGNCGEIICPATAPCVDLCGNGVLDSGESCDDGNRINGDGCNASCALEFTPPLITVTGADGVLIPVTGVDLACQLQSNYLMLSKISMLVGMGCFGLSIAIDHLPKKKEE
jgi:cysteine-rich repeat protein